MTVDEMISRPEARLQRTIQNGGSPGFSFTIFKHSFGGIEWTTKASDKVKKLNELSSFCDD